MTSFSWFDIQGGYLQRNIPTRGEKNLPCLGFEEVKYYKQSKGLFVLIKDMHTLTKLLQYFKLCETFEIDRGEFKTICKLGKL